MNVSWLDELDKKILDVIADNARLSFSEIGEMVGVSRVSVKNHIEALEAKNIIKGYKTIIDLENKESGKRFFIDIIAVPEKYNEVLDYFASCDCVRKMYATTGENRIHIEGYAQNQSQYEAFTQNLRHHMSGIKSIYIADILCTYLEKGSR